MDEILNFWEHEEYPANVFRWSGSINMRIFYQWF